MDNMDHSTYEDLNGAELETQDKPCKICRRRKVRCSKTIPCTNCERANILCEYDEAQGGNSTYSRIEALAHRVKELEALVRQYEEKEKSAGNSMSGTTQGSTLAQSPFAADRIARQLGPNSSIHIPGSFDTQETGKLVIDGSASRHVLSSFWASMYEETGNLKFLLDEDKTMSSHILGLRPPKDANLPPISLILSPAHSEYLLRAYISSVDQSVRVLHKPTLLKQVNLFWRGVLPDFQDFECQLVVIYCLALLSLSDRECEVHLGQLRQTLAETLHGQAEKGLAMLSITTTHKLASLQTFILYVTYTYLTGQTLLASSLLGLAMRAAQRMGVHRDGTHFNLNPWQTESRRRLWHHMLLLDTWCMELHGLESAFAFGPSDTQLPLNADDAAWDVAEFSNRQPASQLGFTDNSFALMQYETAAFMRLSLDPAVSIDNYEARSPATYSQIRVSFWQYIEATYLTHLDALQPQQSLLLIVSQLIKERMSIMHARMSSINHARDPGDTNGHDYGGCHTEDEPRLLADSVSYCRHVQAAVATLAPAHLDWIIIRAFCWNSLMIMLSTTLRQHGLARSADAQWALQRLVTLFKDRVTIDYLRSNTTLWQPIGKLMSELSSRHSEVSRQAGMA